MADPYLRGMYSAVGTGCAGENQKGCRKRRKEREYKQGYREKWSEKEYMQKWRICAWQRLENNCPKAGSRPGYRRKPYTISMETVNQSGGMVYPKGRFPVAGIFPL